MYKLFEFKNPYYGGRMSYLRSLFSMLMVATFFLSNSLCFGEINDGNFAMTRGQNIDAVLGNEIGSSDLQMAGGPPPQWSQNQLSFTFDGSQQSNAIGTFTGYVTFPNRTQYSINGNIGPGSSPISLQVGPPSLLGNYVMTFTITSLSGTINSAQGPYGTAQNLTNGDRLQTTFHVENVGDQASGTFLNRQ